MTKSKYDFRRLISHRRPILLVSLMLLSSLSIGLSHASNAWEPELPNEGNHTAEYDLSTNLTSLNITDAALLQVPNNHTITQASMMLSNYWNELNSSQNRINFSAKHTNKTLSSNYSVYNNGSSLQLLTNNANNLTDDFELMSTVPSDGWLSTGTHGSIWSIISNNTTITTQSSMNLPSNGYENTGFLSTTGFGDLSPLTHSCLLSPKVIIPKIINNYTLTFYQWLALFNTDAVWLEYLDNDQSWSKIEAPADTIADQSLMMVSGEVWNGNYHDWHFVNLSLDNLFLPNQKFTYFKYCIETDSSPGLRGGVFLDQWVISNQGGDLGAWFHGNLTGDYLPRSNSNLIMPVNFSVLPQTDEIEVIMNWDMEGYLYDYLTVEFSDDNGTTWSPISRNYGIPGTGVQHNGRILYGESNGWVPIFMQVSPNSSMQEGLLRFSAKSNFKTNYGGDESSGWEGIAIDHLTLHHSRGTQNHQYILYNNFSSPPNIALGSPDGWLTNSSKTPNQWQWTANLGVFGSESTGFDFNSGQRLSHGWSTWSQTSDIWQQGELLPSINTGGPNFWHSGANGLAVGLNGNYQNEMLTHLYSPEYYIPPSSTARLSFMSWACTEANWDGGAVYVSNNSGLDWWILPAKINNFHDQISYINPNSPFYGQGIIDGSMTNGGCQNRTDQFDYKTYDLSNISGQDIRFRYTFFSDQFIELDGWYIDDAGIEIDSFNQSAQWTSDLLYPNNKAGWGLLDGLVSEPEGTEVRFTILDGLTNLPIQNYTNRTLPVNLMFDSQRYKSIKIQVNLSTNNTYITPKVEVLSIGTESYFDAYHLTHGDYDISDIIITNNTQLSSKDETSISIRHPITCPMAGGELMLIGELESYASSSFPISTNDSTDNQTYNLNSINHMIYLNDTVEIVLNQSSAFEQFRFTPRCLESSANVKVDIGPEETTIFSHERPTGEASLGSTTIFDDVKVDGSSTILENPTDVQLDVQNGQTVTFSYSVLLTNIQHHEDIPISLKIEVNSNEEVEILTDNGVKIFFSSGKTIIDYLDFDSCNEKIFAGGLLSQDAGFASCSFDFDFTGNLSLQVISFIAISPVQSLHIDLPIEITNSVKQDTFQLLGDKDVTIDTHISTDFGRINLAFSTLSYLHLVDRITDVSKIRWLPNTNLSISSSHVRFDPITMSAEDYALSKIKLVASSSRNFVDALFELEVSNLYQNPQFYQISGFSNIAVNADNCSIECSHGYCKVNWGVISKWQMDDVKNIYWLVSATDADGLTTGPKVFYQDSMYNQIENDLEIIDLFATDYRGKPISDWFNPEWPFSIDNNREINVQGKVRFEGAAGLFVSKGDAKVEVKLIAVPPRNVSGGPDEWLSTSINWQQSWFCEVGDNGRFNLNITTPNSVDIPSNVTLRLHASLSRLGPVDEVITTSADRTLDTIHTIFIFDTNSPVITSVEVFDPFGLVEADNHIWTLAQDIPIRVRLSDVEALGTELIIWSWSQYTDDANKDGIMDSTEYRKSTASVNFASNNAEIDLPAFSWQEIKGPNSNGKLSIVFRAEDLANNELLNGGDFGEENDSVTIYLEDQFNTLIDISSISLDLFEDKLLPGYEHTFEFSLTDYNGIGSLDILQFSLIDGILNKNCYIEYFPGTSAIEYDDLCFATPPKISINKQLNFQKWDVSFKFSVNWSVMSDVGISGGIPSLKIFDQGADLNLGTSKIRGLSWNPNLQIEITNPILTDLSAPFGETNLTTIALSPGDNFVITIPFLHLGTELYVTNFSSQTLATCTTPLVGENKVEIISINHHNGTLSCHLSVSQNFVKADFGVELNINYAPHFDISTQINVKVDGTNPYLNLDYNKILDLRSDSMRNISISGQVMEQSSLGSQEIKVNWYFIDKDGIAISETFSKSLALLQLSDVSYSFDSELDVLRDYINVSKIDSMIIWLEYFDNAGLELVGNGSSNDPLLAKLTMVEFMPVINSIIPQPGSIVTGQNFAIDIVFFNTGLLEGTVDVLISDIDGNTLQTTPVYIDSIDFVQQEFIIEAWKSGELELVVSLVNFSDSQTIIVEDVDDGASSRNNLMGNLGLVIILVIVLAGGFGYFYHQNAVRLEQYRNHHANQINRLKLVTKDVALTDSVISEEE